MLGEVGGDEKQRGRSGHGSDRSMQDDIGVLATGLADRRCEQVVADVPPEVGPGDVALRDIAGGDRRVGR